MNNNYLIFSCSALRCFLLLSYQPSFKILHGQGCLADLASALALLCSPSPPPPPSPLLPSPLASPPPPSPVASPPPPSPDVSITLNPKTIQCGTSVAKGRPAFQSSTATGRPASLAVDGSCNTNPAAAPFCAQTGELTATRAGSSTLESRALSPHTLLVSAPWRYRATWTS